MVTRERFDKLLLDELDAPITLHNLLALLSWNQAEGNAGRFNPMNTTLPMPGSENFNWVGVQSYPDLATGVRATAITLLRTRDAEGRYIYHPIFWRLRHNRPAWRTLLAVERSRWGTGGLALACLPFVRASYDFYARKLIAQ